MTDESNRKEEGFLSQIKDLEQELGSLKSVEERSVVEKNTLKQTIEEVRFSSLSFDNKMNESSDESFPSVDNPTQ